MSSDTSSPVQPTPDSHLVQGWFAVREVEPGVVEIEEPWHDEHVKCHLIIGTERALLIDTGTGVGDLRSLVTELTALPLTVLHSHAHWDHIGGTHRFVGMAELLIHAAEAANLAAGRSLDRRHEDFAPERLAGPLPTAYAAIPPIVATGLVHGGVTFDLGGRTLEVIHAPGHSSGGVVVLDRANGILFSTDAAYPGALYCYSDDADLDVYRTTMAMLAELAPALRVVYPSHDRSPMDPTLLPKMRDGLEAIAAGRLPESDAEGIARHEVAGFAVMVAAARQVSGQ